MILIKQDRCMFLSLAKNNMIAELEKTSSHFGNFDCDLLMP
jgi:hypothetical protein